MEYKFKKGLDIKRLPLDESISTCCPNCNKHLIIQNPTLSFPKVNSLQYFVIECEDCEILIHLQAKVTNISINLELDSFIEVEPL